jgi:hypothetical protein
MNAITSVFEYINSLPTPFLLDLVMAVTALELFGLSALSLLKGIGPRPVELFLILVPGFLILWAFKSTQPEVLTWQGQLALALSGVVHAAYMVKLFKNSKRE